MSKPGLAPLSPLELIVLVATLMALNALSIDIMLPALPDIGRSFQVTSDNDRQLVIVSFVMASGIAQIFYGPLADAFGRRRVLLSALLVYLAGSVLCLQATSFRLFLGARVVQGMSAASTRVIAVALVRDLVAGPRMAQIMSTAFMVFMVVPILAPSLGQLVLLVASWRWLLALLLLAGGALLAWCSMRLVETLPPERRLPVRFASLFRAYGMVLSQRATVGYTLAQTCSFGALFSYLTSSQQVFVETFGLGALFPITFGSVGVVLTAAHFSNARLVVRVGLRRLAHRATVAFALFSLLHSLHVLGAPHESLVLFLLLLLPAMFSLGLTIANYGALAMEPMGAVAGSAAALNGFVTTVVGAALGGAIGRAFDGTVVPLVHGHTLLAVAALAIILVAERGQLSLRAEPRPAS